MLCDELTGIQVIKSQLLLGSGMDMMREISLLFVEGDAYGTVLDPDGFQT